ncbi:dihydrolipoyl dehydrogenase [candidate division WOR-3 bacterium]|nr:dihydrolipoyl dehydrogenase [candidate division WOR-3 bacterium]
MRLGIIGGGPGGYSLALRASNKGLDVVLFEREEIGGVCLNVGCIPTKALITCARLKDSLKKTKRLGLKVELEKVDWETVQRFKESSRNRIVLGVSNLLKKRGVELIRDEAELRDERTIQAGKKNYDFDRIIIATGSISTPPGFPVPEGIWDSTDALNALKVPRSLLIVGGGAIGLEFGYIYNCFGSEVSILELESEILPGESKGSVLPLRKNLEKKGIRFYLSSFISEIQRKDIFRIIFEQKGKEKQIESEKVLISIGRTPNINAVPKEIITENRRIKVDNKMRTDMENVYAVGDCIGGYLLAHTAYKEAEIALRNILGENIDLDERVVPRVVYTNPEFASVGSTEEELKEKGMDFEMASFSFSANPRAIASGETAGSVKILYDEKGNILGGDIIGDESSELITQLSLAMEYGIDIKKLSELIYPHPSLSEAIKEAASIADGDPVH